MLVGRYRHSTNPYSRCRLDSGLCAFWNINMWKKIRLIHRVIPEGLALSARGIVNAVVAIVNDNVTTTGTLFLWLAFGLTFTILEAASRFALKLFT